jgi:hypothetical protein
VLKSFRPNPTCTEELRPNLTHTEDIWPNLTSTEELRPNLLRTKELSKYQVFNYLRDGKFAVLLRSKHYKVSRTSCPPPGWDIRIL